jgi:hypothetical protein
MRPLLCMAALVAGFSMHPPSAEAVQTVAVKLYHPHHHHRHMDHPGYRQIRLKSYYWS